MVLTFDKPISMNFKETEQIVNLAKEQGKIAMVGFNRRLSKRAYYAWKG